MSSDGSTGNIRNDQHRTATVKDKKIPLAVAIKTLMDLASK